jgi:tetratricopeptide (TPR) repeat protein
LGDYAKAGETIRIHVNLLDVRRDKTIASESDEGIGVESIFAMVDGLTKKIKGSFDLTAEEISGDLDREVSKITTSSPEAFKYFVEGRKLHLKAEYRQSIDLMERAVAVDPEFAMAYRSLSASYGNMGFSTESKEFIQKAMELSDRLSEKELYQIQGDFFRVSEDTYDQAIEAYTKLLNLYSDDTTASHNLALIYYNIEELDMAQKYLERGVEAETEFVGTFFSIADIHMMKGQYDEAEEILRYYLENVSNHSWIHQYLVFNYICRRQIHIAQAELDIAVSLTPTHRRSFYLKGVYQTLTESFVESEKEFRKALEDKEPAGPYLGHHGLANLYVTQGRISDSISQLRSIIEVAQKFGIQWVESQARSILGYQLKTSRRYQEALREFDKARDLGAQTSRQDLQRLALHYKGLAYLRMRSRSRAQRTAGELKTAIEGWSHQKEIRRYHHLMGMIELDRKKYSEAIDHLETALTLLPSECSQWTSGHILNNHSLYMDSLALAYYRSGDLERAVEQYEKITTLSTGRLYFGDIYAKSFYMLGRIYQQLRENQKAEDYYNKFLALWLNADADISEVSDAQKRLSGLNR